MEFEVEACVDTEITISGKVLTPTSNDDAIYLKMDEESKVPWNLGATRDKWAWKTLKTPFKLAAGKHKLRILHKEV